MKICLPCPNKTILIQAVKYLHQAVNICPNYVRKYGKFNIVEMKLLICLIFTACINHNIKIDAKLSFTVS